MTRSTRRRGANAIEFALTMPFLILLIGAVLDYGWFFTQRSAVHQAVLTGVRQASMAAPGDAVEVAEAEIRAGLSAQGIDSDSANIEPVVVQVNGEDTLEVVASVPYVGLLELPGLPLPPTIDHKLIMRLEIQD